MDGVPFIKMHGIGNDFVVLDAVANPWIAARFDPAALARSMCERHTGVGADGLIMVTREPGAGAPFRMAILNADGSDGGMCGNGARCIAKLLVDRRHAAPDADSRISVSLGDRVLSMRVECDGRSRVHRVSVDMGRPALDLYNIPADPAHLRQISNHVVEFHAGARAWPATLVSMGNPHAVVFLRDLSELESIDLAHDGAAIEHAPAFPRRANAQFAAVQSRDRVRVRTWERGAGPTLGCGSGACAVLVAGVLTGRLDPDATVAMPGGELHVTWDRAADHITMTGPAVELFQGVWPVTIDVDAIAAEGVQITTDRLRLRRQRLADAPAIRRAVSRMEVARFTRTIPHPYPTGAELDFIERSAWSAVTGGWLPWAITLRDSGEVVGAIGYRREPGFPATAEVGYHIAVEHWGKGYATEALRALVDHAFSTTDIQKLHALWYSLNTGSGRVLEKAGFRREGLLRKHFGRWGEVFDVVCVAILREVWEAARGA